MSLFNLRVLYRHSFHPYIIRDILKHFLSDCWTIFFVFTACISAVRMIVGVKWATCCWNPLKFFSEHRNLPLLYVYVHYFSDRYFSDWVSQLRPWFHQFNFVKQLYILFAFWIFKNFVKIEKIVTNILRILLQLNQKKIGLQRKRILLCICKREVIN